MDRAGVIVKLRRRLTGTTQAKVAKDLGITQAYLNDILRGKRDPGEKLLAALGLQRRITYHANRTDERS